jgi:N-methylhydantoinase B/oxoprolinase/acetone carboxylase alpha subunit
MKKGMSKASGYQTRVYCAEYDLNGMIEAYGLDYVMEAAKMIADGRKSEVRSHLKALAYRGSNAETLDDMCGTNNKYHL